VPGLFKHEVLYLIAGYAGCQPAKHQQLTPNCVQLFRRDRDGLSSTRMDNVVYCCELLFPIKANGLWSNGQWSKMRLSERRAELVRAMQSVSILGAANAQWSME